MTDQKIFPQNKAPRKSALKRQRMAVLIGLLAVALLLTAFLIVRYFTSRVLFVDPADKAAKYYAVKVDGAYVLRDKDKRVCLKNEAGNYLTALNTEVNVDAESGACHVVAVVSGVEGDAQAIFDSYYGEYDVLLYPHMERFDADSLASAVRNGREDAYNAICISSIEVHNENGSFLFYLNKNNEYEIKGNPGTPYEVTMFTSLAVSTGYTSTMASYGAEKLKTFEGFLQNGYAEYGLPDNVDDATTYFIITSRAGVARKVVIGNETLTGTGYYARVAGYDSVYILYSGSDSEYSSSFKTTMFARLEDYVTPMAVVSMKLANYFDVSGFTLSRVTDLAAGKYENVVEFSYIPIEIRRGTFEAHLPYKNENSAYEGFQLASYRVDDCLQNLQMMTPLRTVWLDNEEKKELDATVFAGEYGVAYTIGFTFNAQRNGESAGYTPVKSEQYDQLIWVSPKTKDQTYFLYNEMFDMVVEVEQYYLEFLEWEAPDWIESDIFSGNIGYLQRVLFESKCGTTAGVTGVHTIDFKLDNSASSSELTSAGTVDSSGLKVYADYNDRIAIEQNVALFRTLYTTLIYSSLEGVANCSKEEAEAFRASGDEGADLVLSLTYDIAGKPTTFVYRFYHYGGGRYTFVTVNGNGSFCMLRKRVSKIESDFGRMLAGETIKPQVMDGVL